uniref:Uncharacterized protein n=1 Tax=Denticeps clupeoides TaxID=299321 RepID=A0AAY4DUH4_9TELE
MRTRLRSDGGEGAGLAGRAHKLAYLLHSAGQCLTFDPFLIAQQLIKRISPFLNH